MNIGQHLTGATHIAAKLSFATIGSTALFLGAGVAAWIAYRRDLRHLARLAKLNNAELADFGVTRDDLAAVRSDWNPTAALGRIAEARRLNPAA
jgi:uncharacterized protein YjiS (DUF1127 family)